MEETLEEFKSRIKVALLEMDLSDDFYQRKIRDPGAAYAAAIDRAIMLIDGRITSWIDPLPLEQDI